MEPDFTFHLYEQLLEAAVDGGYVTLSVRDYLHRESSPERFLIMRHDVDRKPENALKMARIEADRDISSTYYFRAVEKTFKPDLIDEVGSLGHEVGYHYEDVDTADGDLDSARKSFARNLEQFREFVAVDTVSMHGNPLTPHDNRDLWEVASFDEFDLAGEVYLSVDFEEVAYLSDTNRTWATEKTIVNDWPVSPSMPTPDDVTSTADLISLIESGRLPRMYLLAHPNRWADSTTEWIGEATKDTIINVGKWGLWAARTVRGSHPTESRHA